MTDPVAAVVIPAISAVISILISGGIALWNRRKTDRNAEDLQSVKGDIDRELEKLRAKLTHGQTVSSTQWNAEFAAYQAIWKAIVEVRPVADKLVNREVEILELGIPGEYLDNEGRLKVLQELTRRLTEGSQHLLSAIHDNAPFYPAHIRDAASEAHQTTLELVKKHLAAVAEAVKGNSIAGTPEFHSESRSVLIRLIEEAEKVESLIRSRLAAVQVVNFTEV